jgi:hypothetical protein
VARERLSGNEEVGAPSLDHLAMYQLASRKLTHAMAALSQISPLARRKMHLKPSRRSFVGACKTPFLVRSIDSVLMAI